MSEIKTLIDIDDPKVVWGTIAASVIATILQFIFPPTFENKTKSVKRLVFVFGICFSFIGLLSYLFWDSWEEVQRRKAAYSLYPRVHDLILALMSYSFITVARIISVPVFSAIGERLISRDRYKGEEFDMHVQRFAGQLWKFFFHSTVSIIPLIIFHGQPWWLPGFGGVADLTFEKYPLTPAVSGLKEFYMFQLGYYLHSIVITLLQIGRPNLVSMIVHHLATTALVSVSYLVMNTPRFGVLVMFVHDICDVFICTLRIIADTKLSFLVMIIYPTTMIVWAVFRLYIFPFKIVYSCAYTCFTNGYVDFNIAYSWIPLNCLLFLLIAMHWKWFFELLQMGTKYLKTGATDDTTDSYTPKDNGKKPITTTTTTNGNKKKKNAKAAKKNN